MVITIKKGATKEEVQKALTKLFSKKKQRKTEKFFGKLKGAFGDSLAYQRKLRNEW